MRTSKAILLMVLAYTALAGGMIACKGKVNLPVIMTLYAQSLPSTVKVEWDANATEEQVTFYSVSLDNGPADIIDGTFDCGPTKKCTATIIINSNGVHSVSVTAKNAWDSSLPTVVQFNVAPPSKPRNIVLTPAGK